MKPETMERKIKAALDKAGIAHETRYALTGSVYITVAGEAVVRIADHGECYPPQRGERRLNVEDKATMEAAIAACLAPEFPENVPAYRPAPMTAEEKKAAADYAAKVAEDKARAAAWAEDVTAKVSAAVPAEILATVRNRPAARKVAAQYGFGAGQVWKAATGRNW